VSVEAGVGAPVAAISGQQGVPDDCPLIVFGYDRQALDPRVAGA
jgi:hypothetical protein